MCRLTYSPYSDRYLCRITLQMYTLHSVLTFGVAGALCVVFHAPHIGLGAFCYRSVRLFRLTLGNFWYVQSTSPMFGMEVLWIKHFQMTLTFTLWPLPWDLKVMPLGHVVTHTCTLTHTSFYPQNSSISRWIWKPYSISDKEQCRCVFRATELLKWQWTQDQVCLRIILTGQNIPRVRVFLNYQPYVALINMFFHV